MKGPAAIFYFSGTGNTRLVAGLFEKELRARSVPASVYRIEDVLNGRISREQCRFETLGIGSVIHGFNAPRPVYEFVKRLPGVSGTPAFVFTTAADPFDMNKVGASLVAGRLERKGYDVIHESLVAMPSNIAVDYPMRLKKQLCNRAQTRVGEAVADMLAGRVCRYKASTGMSLLVRLVSFGERNSAFWLGRDLAVSAERCIHCHRCAEGCPTQNIRADGERIRFGWKCVACFRCVYSCPRAAIMPRLYRFAVLKNGYDIEKVFNNEEIKGDFITQETRGFYRRFREYLIESPGDSSAEERR